MERDDFVIVPPRDLDERDWAEIRQKARQIFECGEQDHFKAAVIAYFEWLEISPDSPMVH